MNKNILKYVLRGIIAFGTANLLNGVSLKIVEQKQGESSVQKTVQRSTPIVTPPVSTLPTNNLVDLAGLNCPAMVTLPLLEQNIQIPVGQNPEELVENAEQPDKQAQKNMLVIAKNSSPVQADTLSEKHKKNYQFPRIYRQVSPAKLEHQKADIAGDITAEQHDTDNYDCFCNSGSSNPSYNCSRSNNYRSHSAEDRMLNELIQGMLAQENSGDNHTSPQNYAGSVDTAPQKNTGPKNGSPKDTTKKDSPKPVTTNQTTSTETIPAGIIESGEDDTNSELMQKAMKKLNKKNKKKQEQEKGEATNNRKPEVERTPVTLNIPENKPAEPTVQSKNPAEIPVELVECYNKFVETLSSTAPDVKVIDNFCVQSINWITAAKKNITDNLVQKNLTDYRHFLEQQCAGLDQAITDIRAAKEGTDTEKNMVCQNITQIKSIYESILKAFDATTQQTAQMVPEQEAQPEKNILDRACDKIERGRNSVMEFLDKHYKTISAIGAISGIGAWLGTKYFSGQKKTDKKQ